MTITAKVIRRAEYADGDIILARYECDTVAAARDVLEEIASGYVGATLVIEDDGREVASAHVTHPAMRTPLLRWSDG